MFGESICGTACERQLSPALTEISIIVSEYSSASFPLSISGLLLELPYKAENVVCFAEFFVPTCWLPILS